MAVQVVSIDPSVVFRKALRMRLRPTAVDHFDLISPANQSVTGALQNPCMQFKGRRGRALGNAWVHRVLLLRAGDTLAEKAAHRLGDVFAAC